MRTRSVIIASLVGFVAVLAAVGCQLRARALQTDAGWLLERAQAMADAYVHTFNGAYVDRQLSTYEERRALLDRAHLWHEGTVAFLLLAVASAFAAAGFSLHRKARYEVEMQPGGPVPDFSSEPARAVAARGQSLPQPSR